LEVAGIRAAAPRLASQFQLVYPMTHGRGVTTRFACRELSPPTPAGMEGQRTVSRPTSADLIVGVRIAPPKRVRCGAWLVCVLERTPNPRPIDASDLIRLRHSVVAPRWNPSSSRPSSRAPDPFRFQNDRSPRGRTSRTSPTVESRGSLAPPVKELRSSHCDPDVFYRVDLAARAREHVAESFSRSCTYGLRLRSSPRPLELG